MDRCSSSCTMDPNPLSLPPFLPPFLVVGLKSAGLIRRRKFVDSASIKRQALYEKNRLQALKETSKE